MSLKFSILTRNAIKSLGVGSRLTEHGIVVERTRAGGIVYRINVMVDGQRIHRVIGRESDGVTRTQAEEAIAALRTRAREGRLDLPKGRKTHRMFKEAAREYLALLEETGGKNLVPKRRHLATGLAEHFGNVRLDQITELMVRQYQSKRTKEGAAIGTVNRELATLRHLLNSAARWGWISKGNVAQFKLAAEPQQQMFVLTDVQASALMEAAHVDQDERCWLFVAFGLGTAMRHREILKVRYDQIDFDNRRIFVPDAKAGEREQPITEALAGALRAQQKREADPAGWVFPTMIPKQANAGHRTNMARQFARSVTRAGLDVNRVTPHTMRRTAITKLVKAGVDLPTIQRISGHKTLAMVLRYVNVHGGHIDRAISVLDDAGGIATPKLHKTQIAA